MGRQLHTKPPIMTSLPTFPEITQEKIRGSENVSPEIQDLANRLASKHGNARIAKEKNGTHIYLPSPACILQDGRVELKKMHLSVNADKWLKGSDSCGLCHKTDTRYLVSELLAMPNLAERGIPDIEPRVTTNVPTAETHEKDSEGRWVPRAPGLCVPIDALPETHPAMQYLQSRFRERITPELLTEWADDFGMDFCVQECKDKHYQKLAGGFRKTPQGRVVFNIKQYGIYAGWQGRIPELEDEELGRKWYLHPDTLVYQGVKDGGIDCAGYQDFDPCKYLFGQGMSRNTLLMGLDAAIRWNKAHMPENGWMCVLVEGGMDMALIGAPSIAFLGKYFSPEHERIIAANFSTIYIFKDNDSAGKEAEGAIEKRLANYQKTIIPIEYDAAVVPALANPKLKIKDAARLLREEAWALIQAAYNKKFNKF